MNKTPATSSNPGSVLSPLTTGWLMAGVLLMGLGCAPKRAAKAGVRLVVPPSCLTQDVVIDGCDASSDPPKCKGPTYVHYKSGCEQVQINAPQKP